MMSFLEQLKSKKSVLKDTKTVITQADGKSYVEDSNMRRLGLDAEEMKEKPMTHGFVVDNSPDKVPSEVIRGLYIGSQDCVEYDVISSNKISHILSIGIFPGIPEVHRLCIPCLDLPETDIAIVLNRTNAYIRDKLENGGNVLVHCNAGVSRAAMVVIGFLIMEKYYSFTDAYNLVKSKRSCIQPNVGFVTQLKNISNK
ncbi:MAP kinase-specific phosphatase [Arctopsyche grandis]|uniref:MAP kinase-specific phosphatase n=1 Tax=Arctopsyche grandis TaxID=121162 RepID=UPI00406D6D15